MLINATPLGLAPDDPLPFAGVDVPRATHALDLVYRRRGTPWVAEALRRGLRAEDGRAMLVAQGAAAMERWFLKVRAPREVMHAAVERALG